MSAVSLAPIEAVLSLIVDAINDGVQVVESGKSPVLQLSVFSNLVVDLIPALSNITALPSSLQGFSESDAATLVNFVMNKLAIGNPKATQIVAAALQMAESVYQLVTSIKA